jgi:hypothetical protein
MQLLSERMMQSVLASVLPTLLQLVSSLPSPPPCLRLDQQNLPLLHEEHHPAAAAAAAAAVDLVVTALVKYMSSELPSTLSVLLASGPAPSPLSSAAAVQGLQNLFCSITLHNAFFQFALKSRRNLQSTAISPSQHFSFPGATKTKPLSPLIFQPSAASPPHSSHPFAESFALICEAPTVPHLSLTDLSKSQSHLPLRPPLPQTSSAFHLESRTCFIRLQQRFTCW